MTKQPKTAARQPAFVVDAYRFMKALQGLRPKGRKAGSRNYPAHLSITAGGDVVVLLSEIDCSASIAAEVKEAGSGKLPHEPVLRLMKSFPKGTTVEIRIEEDCVWLDKLQLPMSRVG